MRAMILAFAVMAVIAVGADFALDRTGYSIAEQTSSPSVRLE